MNRQAALRIEGPATLRGVVSIRGSKNATLPIMATSLMAEDAVVIQGAARVEDVETLAQVLRSLGVRIALAGDEILLENVSRSHYKAPARYVSRMRASVCVLGPLLASRGRAVVPLPGGCRLGPRPVDVHLSGMEKLGAEIRIRQRHIQASARRLSAAEVDLATPHGSTVTGTINVLSAAVKARGTSLLRNVAVEPEVVATGEWLNAMGARIFGLGTSNLVVEGVSELGGGIVKVPPDRIEAATYAIAATATQGDVTLCQTPTNQFSAVLEVLREVGARIAIDAEKIRIVGPKQVAPLNITASPYPAIPTDVQPLLTSLACAAHGRSLLRDMVFPHRTSHALQLKKLGADIKLDGSHLQVTGGRRLEGAALQAADLRAAAALVIGGLLGHGSTTIQHAHHLYRGYEQFPETLRQLGAEIWRESSDCRLRECRAVASLIESA